MKKKLIKIMSGLALFIILSFLLIIGMSKYNDDKARKDSKKAVESFLKVVNKKTNETNEVIEKETTTNNKSNSVYYHNYLVIGTIEIPSINLSYPIVKDINKESMKNALVLLYGDNLNKTGNIVLAGHAYLILDVNKLKTNDEIIITDTTGTRIIYYVYNNFLADKNDASFYKRNTNNLKEITISTCTENNKEQRHIIFAKEKTN